MGMKVEGVLFMIVAGLFAATDAGYWYFSKDPTGTVALGLLVGMAFLVGFYMLSTGRRIGARPEDNPEGDIADGAGEFGFYSPFSWWPLWLGAATALTGVGVAIAWWLALLGIGTVILASIGLVFEYYRGRFSH